MSRSSEVQAICREWIDTMAVKNADYGDSHILSGQTLNLWFPDGVPLDTPLKHAFYGLLTRMLDKLIRTANLVLRERTEQVQDEKAYQTIGDNGLYSFMAAELLLHGVDDAEQPEADRRPGSSRGQHRSR